MKSQTVSILVCALLLAGCSGDATTKTDPATRADPPSKAGEKRKMEIDPQLEQFVAQARSDLARRLGVDENTVEVAEAAFVIWPNGALGCPDPDMMYTQALVPGYRIRLDAAGNRYHYHGATGKPPVHCPADRVTAPAAGSPGSGDVT